MDGIVIGNESEQNDSKVDLLHKTKHLSDDGNVKNITEQNVDAETISNNDFLSLKKKDNFYYAERNSIDSLAFVLFASNIDDDRRIGLTYELQPGINKSIIKSFTSSIKNTDQEDLRTLIVDEVKNQCGFIVNTSQIEYLGKCFVSSKMSEFCHLFGVSVDKLRRIKKQTDSAKKKDAGEFWATVEEIKELEDWKCQIIVYKRFLNKKNQIYIKKKDS